MNRIADLLKKKERDLLSIYFTAGFPRLDDTMTVLKNLQEAGADLVEIGMPFSDPLADGPVIQASSQKALQNGMSIELLLDQLKDCRKDIDIPIILMGYLNPIIQYGIEAFLKHCKQVGVDGLILPDLPVETYEQQYKSLFEQCEIDLILLVTPETGEERLKYIDSLCKGFIYAVSSSSTTGKDKDWSRQENYFKRLRDSQLKNSVLVGFGVKDHDTFKTATKYTAGAIIGTAFIKKIADAKSLPEAIHSFIRQLREE